MKKKGFFKVFLILALTILLLFSIAFIVLLLNGKKQDNATINELQYEIDANRQTVFVAKQFIYAGEKLEVGVNIEEQNVVTGLENFNYLQPENVGSLARVDIEQGMPILNSMASTLEITTDTREYEMLVVNLMADQMDYDCVDIRIMFPNGDDYLVLSKKSIYHLNVEQNLFYTYLNEEEILRMASATIDAYITGGTRIYTTRYVEPTLQTEAIPNYPVKTNLIDLINSDPNVLTKAQQTLNQNARINLESRLSALPEEWLEAVIQGRENGYDAQSAVVEEANTVQSTSDVEGIDVNDVFGEDGQPVDGENTEGTDGTETDTGTAEEEN